MLSILKKYCAIPRPKVPDKRPVFDYIELFDEIDDCVTRTSVLRLESTLQSQYPGRYKAALQKHRAIALDALPAKVETLPELLHVYEQKLAKILYKESTFELLKFELDHLKRELNALAFHPDFGKMKRIVEHFDEKYRPKFITQQKPLELLYEITKLTDELLERLGIWQCFTSGARLQNAQEEWLLCYGNTRESERLKDILEEDRYELWTLLDKLSTCMQENVLNLSAFYLELSELVATKWEYMERTFAAEGLARGTQVLERKLSTLKRLKSDVFYNPRTMPRVINQMGQLMNISAPQHKYDDDILRQQIREAEIENMLLKARGSECQRFKAELRQLCRKVESELSPAVLEARRERLNKMRDQALAASRHTNLRPASKLVEEMRGNTAQIQKLEDKIKNQDLAVELYKKAVASLWPKIASMVEEFKKSQERQFVPEGARRGFAKFRLDVLRLRVVRLRAEISPHLRAIQSLTHPEGHPLPPTTKIAS